jgi:DNA-binding transcriptional MerR regulator
MSDIIKDFLKNALSQGQIVDFGDIPDISLYMDQLTTFIDERMKGYARVKNDKILTKTMINNYTKDNVLPPSIKKRYDKEHVALLILIYHLKSSLTINDISNIFDIMEDEGISVETVYRAFTKMQAEQKARLDERLDEISEELKIISGNDAIKGLFTVLALAAESSARKLLAEKLIDYIHGGGKK